MARNKGGILTETSVNYTSDTAYFSSDERKWHTRIRKLAEEHPDEVTIIRQPEENDGCLYARLPAIWLKIQPKRAVNFTDEQIAVFRERLAQTRSKTAAHPQKQNKHEERREDDG